MKIVKILLFSFVLLLVVNCILLNDDEPEADPDPFVPITGREDIIGEWVCYYTYLKWRHGSQKFYLDKELEEDVIKIDSNRLHWRFLLDGVYYEYDFPYILKFFSDSSKSFFCKDSAFLFDNYPKHHWGEPFGEFQGEELYRIWVTIRHNSTDLHFQYNPDSYTSENAYYTKKIRR